MNSNLFKCASGSRLRETAAHAHIFMAIHGRLCLSEVQRNGHKNSLLTIVSQMLSTFQYTFEFENPHFVQHMLEV